MTDLDGEVFEEEYLEAFIDLVSYFGELKDVPSEDIDMGVVGVKEESEIVLSASSQDNLFKASRSIEVYEALDEVYFQVCDRLEEEFPDADVEYGENYIWY